MKKILFSLLLLVTFVPKTFAYYDLDSKLQEAFHLIFSLNFSGAEKLLNEEKIEKPDNNLGLLYRNYIDFLKTFISEDPLDFEKFKKLSGQRLMDLKLLESKSSSPFHLYAQSEILIQRALVGIKFEENIISAKEIKRAYQLIERNKIIFPTFILNTKVSGFLHVIIGSVPSRFQWIVTLAGMNGSINQGLLELNRSLQYVDSSIFRSYQTEIIFSLGSIYSAFSLKEGFNDLLRVMNPVAFKNQLIAYVYSNILMKQGENEKAIAVIDSSLKVVETYPVLFLYYKRGLARLRKMDFDASGDFEYFLKNYKGRNSVKSAFQKLAWIGLLKGDTAEYLMQLENCKKNGSELLDEDKDASYEASSGEISNVYLLRSRLLFDGGYYNQALSELTTRKISDFKHFHDQLEITYRIGRIMQMTGQTEKAIENYQLTLKNGSASSYHFAANSALMLGIIAEEKNQFKVAGYYYKKCLSLSYDHYKNSIDQKAKAGLERIEEKDNK